MSITRRAIENNRVTTVAVISILFGGIIAYTSLPRALDPGFTIRIAQILTVFPGASPERVEMLVSDKLEKAIQEIPELDNVTSISKPGISIVLVAIKEKYNDMRPIWDSLRRKVDGVRSSLPDGIVGPDVNDEFGDTFGIVLGLTGDGYTYAELKRVADDVRDELLRIEEAAKVDIHGAQEERVFVEYNNARLARLGLSPSQLKRILEARNIIIPGGSISTADERIVLEPSGNFESVDELGNTLVQLPGRKSVSYLKDLVTVRRGYIDPPKSKMRTNGAPSLGLAISLRKGGNVSVLGQKVRAVLDQLPEQYPHGIDFSVVAFIPDNVNDKVNDFVENVGQSVLIVLAVMLLTLGLRTGLLVASLIPTTMVLSLLIMSIFDIGLDQVSLASLIIALGMLVDNAIVMTESIMVQMRQGKPPIEAAVDSAAELRIPLLTSSLTTSAAFLPIFLAESQVGEYTTSIFKVVTIALLSSWVLALTLSPMLSVMFLKKPKPGEKIAKDNTFDSRFYRGYRSVLTAMLRQRYVTLMLTIAVFVVAMIGFSKVRQLFFPKDKDPRFNITLRLPVGTPVARTERAVAEVEKYIRDELRVDDKRKEGVLAWASFIGAGAPRYTLGYNPEPPAPEYAYIMLTTTSSATVEALIPKVETHIFDNFPDAEVNVAKMSSGPPVTNPIEIRISGKNTDRLFAIVDTVKAKLRTIAGPKAIADNWGARTKKLFVDIDQPRAYRAGLTSQDIAVSLLTNLSGFQTSEYREEDRVIPITMRSVAADRSDVGKLDSLNIYAQATGRNVPLKQVADTRIAWEPAKVIRRNRLRTVTVRAQLDPGVTAAAVNAQITPWLDAQERKWGIGYRYSLGGEAESSVKANQSIADKMPIAFFIILILLVAQFNSLRRTAIILFTIPMALIGVVVGLLAADSYFGFMTLLGVVSLAGIVINNAIVLLERIKLEIEVTGLTPQRAVIEAAQRRLRPILLTTATTIGGLLPLWFAAGPMWEPMAIAIIFGLAFSTVLTLGVIPALYSILFRVSYRGYHHDAA